MKTNLDFISNPTKIESFSNSDFYNYTWPVACQVKNLQIPQLYYSSLLRCILIFLILTIYAFSDRKGADEKRTLQDIHEAYQLLFRICKGREGGDDEDEDEEGSERKQPIAAFSVEEACM